MRCHDVREEMIDLAAGAAPADRAALLERHAASCDECGRFLSEQRRTWDALGLWRSEAGAPSGGGSSAIFEAVAPRPRYVKFALSLLAAAAAFYLVFGVFGRPSRQPTRDELTAQLYPPTPTLVQPDRASALVAPREVAVGEASPWDVRLPDGTTMLLAPKSRVRVMRPPRGVRFACALQSGGMEIEATPGEPIRVRVLGGFVESLGTRFLVRVVRRPGESAEATAYIRVLKGRVRVVFDSDVSELAAGESRVQTLFRGRGEIVGRFAGEEKRELPTETALAWRIETEGLGRVWVHHSGKKMSRPTKGAWVRVKYGFRAGLMWARSFELLPRPAKRRDCSVELPGGAGGMAASLRLYRTLSHSTDPKAVLAAARELVLRRDPLAAPRALRACLRMASIAPRTTEDLKKCFIELPRPRVRGGGGSP